MKVHQLREYEPTTILTLGCNRLHPLASAAAAAAFGLKSFIRPESGSTKHETSDYPNRGSTQAEPPGGGRRWNPTQEQLAILEMLYRGGTRTPNAQEIEQITSQLSSYGQIEGKNVFYWFQNHKARERQKQRRISLGLTHTRRTTPSPFAAISPLLSPGLKRKSRSWGCAEEGDEDRTLKLFPLHPDGGLRINWSD